MGLFLFLVGCQGDATGPAESRIGPEGGSVTLEDGAVVLTVPAGALLEEVWFTAIPTVAVPDVPAAVSGTTYELGPPGTVFGSPVTITVLYDAARLPQGTGADDLGVFQVQGGAWSLAGTPAVNPAAGTVSGQLTRLGRVGVLGIPVAAVEVSPASVTLAPGGSTLLAATVKAETGASLTGRPVTWSTSDPAVATVGSDGRVTGIGEGSAVVTARSDGQSGAATVTVIIPVAAVDVTPGAAELEVGGRVQLTARPLDTQGNPLPGRTVTWSSNDVGVAQVDGRGMVTALARGSAAITAAVGGQVGTAAVTVHGDLSVTTVSLARGVVGAPYSQALAAAGGDGEYLWSVAGGFLPPGLSLGTETGLIAGTPTEAGSKTFTVKVESAGQTSTRSLAITVDLVPVASVTLSPSAAELTLGDTLRLVATARDSAGSVLTGRPVVWASSHVEVVTVSATGLLTALSAGTSTVTATVAGFPGWAAVRVNDVLTVTNTLLKTGVVGAAYRDTLAAVGGNGSYRWKLAGGALPGGLSLAEGTGIVSGTPTAAGISMFAVEVTSGDGQVASATLTMAVYGDLTVSTGTLPDGVVGSGYNRTLAASGGDPPYTWTLATGSLPPGLALNTISGVISGTPTTEGTSEFSVEARSHDGQRATKAFSVTVDPVPVASVELSPAGISLVPGETALLAATVRDASGNQLTGRSVSWASSDEGVAAVSSGGLVTAAGLGFALVTASVEGKTATATVTVYSLLRVLTSSLAGGSVGASYDQALAATGGNGAYSWSVSAGVLPDGLALDPDTGLVNGAPTTPGSWAFTVHVESGDGQTAAADLSITVG